MVRMFIDGVEVARESSASEAAAMRDALRALTYGDDARVMSACGYCVIAACALLDEYGGSAQRYFVDAVEAPVTLRCPS